VAGGEPAAGGGGGLLDFRTPGAAGVDGAASKRVSPSTRPLTMPIKKSDLYAKLWASCDELRGGMDASRYMDYVLVMLFIKYVSDKYAGQPFAPIQIPPGASFADMLALKGRSDIGDQINKTIIRPLEEATMTTLGYALNAPQVVRQKASRGQGDAVVHISSAALGSVSLSSA
jgi:hypothetical protein